MPRTPLAPFVLLALLCFAFPAGAVNVDGQLDPEYGTPLATQTTQTGLGSGQIGGDNSDGDLNLANGSELDVAYGFIADGVLHLFLAGNVANRLNNNQNATVGHLLDLFLDTRPGGQNTLFSLGSGNPLNGLTFDAGFEADFHLELEGNAGEQGQQPTWSAWYQEIHDGSGDPRVYLGFGSAGGPGTLVGGTNPHGILATIDNRNIVGVGYGCNAASGAGVTTGTEWALPLAALGNPGGCIRVVALLRDRGTISPVSNQFLGSAPPGTCPPGPVSGVNLASIGGDQFVTVCPSATDVTPAAGASFALRIAGPNPSPGGRVSVAFTLPDSRPATVRMVDCAGRVVRERTVSATGGGSGVIDLSEGAALAPGVYWVHLRSAQGVAAKSVCIVR